MKVFIAICVAGIGSIITILACVPQVSLAARVKMGPAMWFIDIMGFFWGSLIGSYSAFLILGARILPYGRIDERTMWKPKTKWGQQFRAVILIAFPLIMGFIGANFLLGEFRPIAIK